MSWLTASREEHLKAQEIVLRLRERMTREAAAIHIGISPSYVSFAMSCQLRIYGGYQCPAWAIQKILSYENSCKSLTPAMKESVA